MRRFRMVLVMWMVWCSASALAMTELTDSELGGVSGQSGAPASPAVSALAGLGSTLPSGAPGVSGGGPGGSEERWEAAGPGNGHGLPEGTGEVEIRMRNAVVDIERLEIDLLRTDAMGMGHMTLEGFHMKIESALIYIRAH